MINLICLAFCLGGLKVNTFRCYLNRQLLPVVTTGDIKVQASQYELESIDG